MVIPSWQRAPWLSRCLDGLSQQTRIPDETLVALRREDREARDVVGETDFALPVRGVEVYRPEHIAPVLAGLKEARGDIVAFLDADVIRQSSARGDSLRLWPTIPARHSFDEVVEVVSGWS